MAALRPAHRAGQSRFTPAPPVPDGEPGPAYRRWPLLSYLELGAIDTAPRLLRGMARADHSRRTATAEARQEAS